MNIFGYILAVIILIGVAVVAFYVLNVILDQQTHITFGQTLTPPATTPPAATAPAPPAVTPTPVPTPTPTAPAPQFQYLPQKSYVQTFAPEQGIPTSAAGTVVPQYLPAQQQQSGGGFDINTLLSLAALGGTGIAAKLGIGKANKAEALAKDGLNVSAVQSDQIEQTVRTMFKLGDPNKVATIDDAPAIKLDNLNATKKDITEKAAKS